MMITVSIPYQFSDSSPKLTKSFFIFYESLNYFIFLSSSMIYNNHINFDYLEIL